MYSREISVGVLICTDRKQTPLGPKTGIIEKHRSRLRLVKGPWSGTCMTGWQLTGSHRHMSQKRTSSKQSECCDHQNVLHPGMLHMSPANHCCTAPLKLIQLVQFLNRSIKNTCVVECIRIMSIYPRVCWQSSMKMHIKIS